MKYALKNPNPEHEEFGNVLKQIQEVMNSDRAETIISATSFAERFLNEVHMCAAIWASLYDAEDRDFDMSWAEMECPEASVVLLDAAQLGMYSIYPEGAIVKFLVRQFQIVPLGLINVSAGSDGIVTSSIARADINPIASDENWDNLVSRISEQFKRGIHSSDIPRISEVVNILKKKSQLSE